MSRLRAAPSEVPGDLRVLFDGDTMVMSFELPVQSERKRLTPAELDVLADLLAGRSNREIARRRGRSTRTVANQVSSILSKLGALSRLELIALVPLSR